jgi:hypothetical protein
VETQPGQQSLVEGAVDRVSRPTWLFRLQPCPGGVECLESTLAIADATEPVAVEILDHEPLLEGEQRPWVPASGLQDGSPTQHAEAKGVQRDGVDFVAAFDPKCSELVLEVGGGHAREGDGQDALWLASLLETAGNTALQREGLACARSGNYLERRGLSCGDVVRGAG